MGRYLRLILIVFALFLILGCSKQAGEGKQVVISDSATKGTDTIMINHFIFEPEELTVDMGTTLTWKHNDNVAHNIVSSGLFESEVLSRGGEFTFTFTEKGEYSYYCGIHPSMKGKIIVK